MNVYYKEFMKQEKIDVRHKHFFFFEINVSLIHHLPLYKSMVMAVYN